MGKSIYCEMEISWGIVLEEKSQIVPIRNGSVITWHHVNLQGEYNFSDEYLEGAFISEDKGQRIDDGTQRTEIGIWPALVRLNLV